MVKTLLIYPPLSGPVHPPLGIAKLTGFLREHNKDVEVIDLNINSYDYFIDKEILTYHYEKVKKRIEDLDKKTELDKYEKKEYECLIKSFLDGPYIIENAVKSLENLRGESVYKDWKKYSKNSEMIFKGMKLVGDSHYPAVWNPRELTFSKTNLKTKDLLDIVNSKKENFFIPYFQENMEKIKETDADIIGISVNFFCQLIPALTLANIIRKHCDKKIFLGGSLFASYRDDWSALEPLKIFCNVVIPFAGETPLLKLIQSYEEIGDFSKGEGIIDLDRNIIEFKETEQISLEGVLPDFSDFDLKQYLSDKPVLPYVESGGCYWGKCTFCSQHILYSREKTHEKSAEKMARELKELSRIYNVKEFFIVDEAIPIQVGVQLAEKLKNTGIKWFCDMRFEPDLTADAIKKLQEGGCRMLLMGMESSVPRVLKLMKKGISSKVISRVLRDCRKYSLRTFVMFFIGFPGETEEEALQTIEFMENHRDDVHFISFDRFVLLRNTPVFNEPDEYGLEVKEVREEKNLSIFADYSIEEGLSKKEADQLLRKIRKRPIIKELSDYVVISRSHMAFLPLEKKSEEVKKSDFDFNIRPKIKAGVRFVDLKNITWDKDKSHDQIQSFCYNPQNSKIVSVNSQVERIIRSCTGEVSIREILEIIPKEKEKDAINLFEFLWEKEII